MSKEKEIKEEEEVITVTSQEELKGDVQSESQPESKKNKKPPIKSVSTLQLFRFATKKERIMLFIAFFFSMASSALQPVSIVIYGSFINKLTGNLASGDGLVEKILPVVRIMAYMGTAAFVSAYISNCLWVMTGESQTRRIRSLYLHSILRQDMSWFDQHEDGSLNTRLASDSQIIQDGISEKFGLAVGLFAQFVGGMAVAFAKGWPVACMMLAVLPLIFGSSKFMVHFIKKYTYLSQQSFAEAGTIAEQTFQSIRTVYAFSLQKRFLKRYEKHIDEACDYGVKKGVATGVGFGFFLGMLFCSFGLALWYGSKRVVDGTMTGTDVFVSFVSMMMGSMSFLKLPGNLAAVSSAKGAAYKIFEVIDRVPPIDPDSQEGLKFDKLNGSIEFKNVFFKYPTRPDVVVLKDLSLKIKPGQTVAFVGPSGSGKSTTIQLVQRFYDVLSGQVIFDGHDVKDINVKWLRQQIGIVSQEPVLFNMTVRQNLLMGAPGEVSEKVLISACKEANCHSFITQLPKGYDTIVGELGSMLSGGQKQRIAIARAILKNPSILLLDEATSALDTQSERLVQVALDKASATRTTIVVAHRLSTIMNADHIVVLDHGIITEQGTHQELIDLGGTYADLVNKQAIETKEKIVEGTEDKNEEELLAEEQIELKQLLSNHENGANLSRIQTAVSGYSASFANTDKKAADVDVYELKRKRIENEKKLILQQRTPFVKVFFHMKKEWNWLFAGLCGSAIAGSVFPLYSFAFSHVISILAVPGQDIRPGPLSGTNLYSFLFLIIGIGAFLGNVGQFACYEICGEKFARRLRSEIYEAYLKQEVGFFDREENNTGALTTRLAVDSRNVSEMITKVWGDLTNLTTTIIVAFSIAFSSSWALSLIVLTMSPFMMGAMAYEFRIQRGFEDDTKRANAESGQVAGEAIREHRTVASLNKQNYFEDRYFHATDYPHKLAMKKAYLSSIAAACGRGITIYTNALAFYAGARLIAAGQINFQQMFTSMTVIMTASETAGRSTTFASTFSKAKVAAISSYNIIERQPEIDPELEGIEPEEIKGDIEFSNVKFIYPARPDITIFDGEFGFQGKAGDTIALVGASGCGKSTTIGMLERWYDVVSGKASVDDTNVKSYSLHNLRSHMALVGQEPVLFDITIGENIRFGIDESKNVTQEDVEEACKAANIHQFISELPDGYDTRVGDKGSQLSGGQKQRIAIARALLRKPKVLLLDEATSALDSDSERLVQEALDNIIEKGGRTTITIAHRLSTIKNADLICVVKDGRVVEQGKHFELLKLNGVYTEMVNQQSLNVL